MSKATIVVDGQYGSTGKGKIAHKIAKDFVDQNNRATHFVRTGGPNSGHSVHRNGQLLIFRQLGAGAVLPGVLNYIAAGCVIDEERLLLEFEQSGLGFDNLIIDPRAVLLEPEDSASEHARVAKMGTTASGNGAAMIRRMLRGGDVRLAGDSKKLREIAAIETVAPYLHAALRDNDHVVVEGVQGFLLSLFHSPCYPFCTARDTSASAFASEVGLAPAHVGRVVLVMRAFPIRVGGNSGPLKNEVTWEQIAAESGAPVVEPELTSVTKRLRRVGRFDFEAARMACEYNQPSSIAIMGVDRIEYSNRGARTADQLGHKTREFLYEVEDYVGVPVEFIGTGPHTDDLIRVSVH